MKDDIYLYRLEYNEQHEILNLINKDIDLHNTFSGERNTISRILNADYIALIKKGNINIGFVMLVNNLKTNMYEIDMGILKKYRNKGYGTQVLSILKSIILKNKIKTEIQIKKTNIGAIKSVLKNGFILSKNDKNCNYYTLLDKSKKNNM